MAVGTDNYRWQEAFENRTVPGGTRLQLWCQPQLSITALLGTATTFAHTRCGEAALACLEGSQPFR